MADSFVFPVSEYSTPSRVSYFFEGEEDTLLSTRIEVLSPPRATITFSLDRHKHHTSDMHIAMSGGVSPQSRIEETLHKDIADHLFIQQATLQKRIVHEPVTLITEKIVVLSMPSRHEVRFIGSSETAKRAYYNLVRKTIFDGIIIRRTLDRALLLDMSLPDTEDTLIALAELKPSLERAGEVCLRLSGRNDISQLVAHHLSREVALSPKGTTPSPDSAIPQDSGVA